MSDIKKYPNKIILEKQYESLKIQREEILRRLYDSFKTSLKKQGIRANLKFRIKTFESYYDKLIKKLKNNESNSNVNITDLLGFRIVCHFLEDLDIITDFIKDNFQVVEELQKGFEHSFKEFGYDSTHFLIEVPADIKDTVLLAEESVICEIQLRTTLQDAWAEVEHEIIYKAESNLFNLPIKRKLAALNANLSLSDIIFQEIRDSQKELNRKMKKRRKSFFEKIESENDILVSETVYKNKINNLIENERFELSHQYMQKDSIDNLLMKALSLHNQNSFEGAVSTYDLILEKKPELFIQSIVFVHRGMAHFALSNHDKALSDFSDAIKVKPFNPKAYYYRGIVNRIIKNTNDAINDFSECLKNDPFNDDALLARSQTYFQIGENNQAKKDCMKSLHINPDSDEARRFLDIINSK